jgi:hypothetical protein
MVTAAHSDNGRNQLTCIEKDKPKNNNKIRQHEKNKPIFQFLLSFFLVQSLFCSNNHHYDCHRRPLQKPPAAHAASPLPPPSSLPHQLSSSLCRCISKRAAATAKIALLPSCRLCCQAGRRHRAPAATTSANAWQLPCYHCLQNK